MELGSKETQSVLNISFDPNDEIRPYMAHPFIQGGYVYATEGHWLIRIPISIVPDTVLCQYTEQDMPNCTAVIPDEFDMDETITYNMVRAVFDSVPMEKVCNTELVECKECYGTGMVTYTYYASDCKAYEMEGECPMCEGSGTVEEDNPDDYKIAKDERALISIKDRLVYAKTIFWLEGVMANLGLKKIHLRTIWKHEFYCTAALGIGLLFMEVLPDFSDNKNIIKLI